MTLLDVADIQHILERHTHRLGRCVWPIWERFLAIPEADRLAYDLVAEANILNRYMIDFAKKELTGVPGIEFFNEDGFVLGIDGFQYGLAGQLACRFKKLDGSGRSRNNLATSRARAVRNNATELLDGVPPEATWTDIGYVLNGLRTGIAEVQVIRLADTAFIMSIPREDGGVIMMPRSFGPDGDSGSGSGSLFLIKPRKEGRSNGDEKSLDE